MVAVDRVQTGVRLERRLLKVLKGLAEYLDLTLGDLLEGIALHAFEQKLPFDDATVAAIETLKKVYALDLTAADSHRLSDAHRPRSAQAQSAQAQPAQAQPAQAQPAQAQPAQAPPAQAPPAQAPQKEEALTDDDDAIQARAADRHDQDRSSPRGCIHPVHPER